MKSGVYCNDTNETTNDKAWIFLHGLEYAIYFKLQLHFWYYWAQNYYAKPYEPHRIQPEANQTIIKAIFPCADILDLSNPEVPSICSLL